MDTELLPLLEKAVRDGIASELWLILFLTAIGAGLGAFFGAYLKRKGDEAALRENFAATLRQLQEQTRVAEGIKSAFSVELEKLKALLEQDVFVRELYGTSIKDYATEQAAALRQVYLLLYEPQSSVIDAKDKGSDDRVTAASDALLQPLRKHLGLLDEATLAKIYGVQHELLKLTGADADQFTSRKNHVFNTIEMARQFVKVDRIAFRLGLIKRVLDNQEKES